MFIKFGLFIGNIKLYSMKQRRLFLCSQGIECGVVQSVYWVEEIFVWIKEEKIDLTK